MRLGLGTAQFGLDYGVSNARGKVPRSEVQRILDLAAASAVPVLDTAPSYGDSEAAIGTVLARGADFRVVTKTPVFDGETIGRDDVRLLIETFRRSRETLQRERLHALLFHRAADILKPGGGLLVDAALRLIESGEVAKIGVSVYTAAEIDRVLELFTPDVVQLPINVFDQRLIASGHVSRLRELGSEIHVRSVLLQGLLLMEPRRLPRYLEAYSGHMSRYFEAVSAAGLTALEAALGFAMSVDADIALIGVTSVGELDEALRCAARAPGPAALPYELFALDDAGLLDPSRWQLAPSIVERA